jgi:AraC-like DNA-binding protein
VGAHLAVGHSSRFLAPSRNPPRSDGGVGFLESDLIDKRRPPADAGENIVRQGSHPRMFEGAKRGQRAESTTSAETHSQRVLKVARPTGPGVWRMVTSAPSVPSLGDELHDTGFGNAVSNHPTTVVHAFPRSRPIWALQAWRLRRVTEYIDTHLASALPLSKLAVIAGLSRMHFAAQFRMAMGLSPHQFVLRQRVERAKAMLAETKEEIVDIALSVGFQSQAHFTTVFKRFVGETPWRWRCRIRNRFHQKFDRPAEALGACEMSKMHDVDLR